MYDYSMVLAAPGVWRMEFGSSEKLTPFKVIKPICAVQAIERLPLVDECPIALDKVLARKTLRGFEFRLPLETSEKLYGLGLQLLSFEQTGLKKTLRVNSDPRADLGDSHAPVPFYVSTAGYGVLVDSARYVNFYCDSTSVIDENAERRVNAIGLDTDSLYASRGRGGERKVVIEIPGEQGGSLLIFAGPSFREVVQRYNLFSGGGAVPPRWALGVWYRVRSDFKQDEVISFANDLRSENMPCDVLGLEPGWQSHAYSCSHVWSEHFPDPAGMVSKLRHHHYQVNLWTHAFTDLSSPVYEKLLPYAGEHTVFGGLVPDFLQPEAEEIFRSHYTKVVVDLGIAGLKLDECDNSDFIKNPWSFPEFSRFPSGVDGEQMHSLFGLLLQRMFTRLYASIDRRTWGLVRSSQAAASQFPFVLYSDLYDHRQLIRGIASSAFSGLLWTPEVREAASGEELLRRMQSGVASPMLLINAWYIQNPPWKQWDIELNNNGKLRPDWPDWQDKCRRIFELRMQLVPYLHNCFYVYAKDGIPPFRPLVMDYPQAPQAWNCDDQILIGDRIMAAPITSGSTSRKVWIPPGTWIDFHSKEVHQGNQLIEISPAPDILPLYVRDGSVLPLALPTLHTEDPVSFHLEVRIYGKGDLPASLIEEAMPEKPFAIENVNILDLTWNEARRGLSQFRSRRNVPPLYEVKRIVMVDSSVAD